MQREAIYEAWVPQGGVWSLWARPVLFAQMPDTVEPSSEQPWLAMAIDWVPPPGEKVVVVLDLPGDVAVHFGLALAGRGFRPVPLFNGCTGPNEAIDQGPILRALQAGAAYLGGLSLPADAPPAFLLDSRRGYAERPLRPGVFDNRWKVFPEDFPSEEVLQQRAVRRVLLVQRDRYETYDDLARVLRYWQEAGIALEAKYLAEPGPPRRLVVPAIPWYRRWWYGLLALLGVQRSPRDGFGYVVPEPSHG
jgi:hypothetical protein